MEPLRQDSSSAGPTNVTAPAVLAVGSDAERKTRFSAEIYGSD